MKRLVMVGVGATQLSLLEGLAAGHVKAVEPVLISAVPAYVHDGMQPGWLAGRYDEEAMSIDLGRLAIRAGCRYVESDIERIDAGARTIVLSNGRTEKWEALSLTSSSIPCDQRVPGAAEFAYPIAELELAQRLRAAIDELHPDAPVTVVGAGLTGVETASELAEQGRKVTLVCGGGWPRRCRRRPDGR